MRLTEPSASTGVLCGHGLCIAALTYHVIKDIDSVPAVQPAHELAVIPCCCSADRQTAPQCVLRWAC
jgi:hypothetical protein